ncbi:hypothetical protein HY768_10690 [candidate division TA06 bacterium]|uniref:site-specific DNA-methyltransferase (cytosine-N(4)-specific) n=1 Tax=candidate division TA06 bacterium TaxID=2250710 RepID=A0A933ICA8_UNCT6|nr:hypothetical protein [candidate division TA06 bacterium]
MKITPTAIEKEQLELYGIPALRNDSIVSRIKDEWTLAQVKAPQKNVIADYGTFKDSLKAPIHRWFKYPAGYSYRLVDAKIKQYKLTEQHWLFDPFVGSGTTSIEAKRNRVNSVGIEAHPFVYWISKCKMNWDINLNEVSKIYLSIINVTEDKYRKTVTSKLPELVHKCYSEKNLRKLLSIRNAIENLSVPASVRDFYLLALVDTLRNASKAATGWPYIAPNKIHEKAEEKEAFEEYGYQVRRMYDDIHFFQNYYNYKDIKSILIKGDSRKRHERIEDESMDLALTSPPYLNNYDYADRTRLETYFLGWYRNWGEISDEVREKLITSATTQIRRGGYTTNYGLKDTIRNADSKLYNELFEKVSLLRNLRNTKGGKKSYDCLVAGYFSDMFDVICQTYRVLRKGSDFVLVLGDSAPYGIYIPTHEYLGRMGISIGFKKMAFEELRTRGDKWKGNPQRHKVKLKEVILTLSK